jgi:hypothetical protein
MLSESISDEVFDVISQTQKRLRDINGF